MKENLFRKLKNGFWKEGIYYDEKYQNKVLKINGFLIYFLVFLFFIIDSFNQSLSEIIFIFSLTFYIQLLVRALCIFTMIQLEERYSKIQLGKNKYFVKFLKCNIDSDLEVFSHIIKDNEHNKITILKFKFLFKNKEFSRITFIITYDKTYNVDISTFREDKERIEDIVLEDFILQQNIIIDDEDDVFNNKYYCETFNFINNEIYFTGFISESFRQLIIHDTNDIIKKTIKHLSNYSIYEISNFLYLTKVENELNELLRISKSIVIPCIHTKLQDISIDEFNEINNTSENRLSFFKESLKKRKENNLEILKLDFEEDYKAFKSWIEGICEEGLNGLVIQNEIEGFITAYNPISIYIFKAIVKINPKYILEFIEFLERYCKDINGKLHIDSFLLNVASIFSDPAILFKEDFKKGLSLFCEVLKRIRLIIFDLDFEYIDHFLRDCENIQEKIKGKISKIRFQRFLTKKFDQIFKLTFFEYYKKFMEFKK
jgi:multisubunit Na+/H+ antiporter MnhE subunit